MWTIISVLVLVGLLMMILEILVIPGSGFAGIVGFVLMAAGVWLAYTRIGVTAGNVTLITTITINVIGLILALRSKTWKKASLSAVNKGKVNEIDANSITVGMKGVTVSRCAPMGKANFNDKFYEVSTLSEFVEQDNEVEIIRISGNKIYIKKINN